jgi:arylsulfatase
MKSKGLKFVVLFFCLVSVFCANAKQKPNVIVIVTDDQGYGDLSCHGNPVLKTPNLDKLHGESIRFTDFHAAPVCTPTRGQILTGRDAMHNGAWAWAFGHEMIHEGNITMANVFKNNGYATGHFGKWHLGDNYPYRPGDKGFDESITLGGAATHQTPDYWQGDLFDDYYRHKDGEWRQHKGYSTDVWFDLSMDFMKRCQADDKPFFIYLPTNAPHTPLYVDESYSKPFSNLKDHEAKFFGMIVNFDENMGRLDKFMTENNLVDNTIVIYMTDNGGTAGADVYNADMRGTKTQFYEGGHRVPCFVRWPEGKLGEPRDIDELTQTQDLLPTLIDLLSLEVDKKYAQKFDGTSLVNLMKGKQNKPMDRKLVVQWSHLDYPQYGAAAVMWKKWRLVHDKELYNLEEDPSQKNDVASQYPEIVKSMKAHYADWWETVKPVVSIWARPVVGGAENPSRLTCFEWAKKTSNVNVTQQGSVWNGGKVNGTWMLNVETAGKYRFELRRYPKEADFPMSGAYPETKREYRTFGECRALPITQARIKIGSHDKSMAVAQDDKCASFELTLEAGDTELKTWLMDKDGNELCGAYYVEVVKL